MTLFATSERMQILVATRNTICSKCPAVPRNTYTLWSSPRVMVEQIWSIYFHGTGLSHHSISLLSVMYVVLLSRSIDPIHLKFSSSLMDASRNTRTPIQICDQLEAITMDLRLTYLMIRSPSVPSFVIVKLWCNKKHVCKFPLRYLSIADSD